MCINIEDPVPKKNNREKLDSIFSSLEDLIATISDVEIIKE